MATSGLEIARAVTTEIVAPSTTPSASITHSVINSVVVAAEDAAASARSMPVWLSTMPPARVPSACTGPRRMVSNWLARGAASATSMAIAGLASARSVIASTPACATLNSSRMVLKLAQASMFSWLVQRADSASISTPARSMSAQFTARSVLKLSLPVRM
jgi:hypothetical protein